jgi:hypothetical protein
VHLANSPLSYIAHFRAAQVEGAIDWVGEEVCFGEPRAGDQALHGVVVSFQRVIGEDVGDGDTFADELAGDQDRAVAVEWFALGAHDANSVVGHSSFESRDTAAEKVRLG